MRDRGFERYWRSELVPITDEEWDEIMCWEDYDEG